MFKIFVLGGFWIFILCQMDLKKSGIVIKNSKKIEFSETNFSRRMKINFHGLFFAKNLKCNCLRTATAWRPTAAATCSASCPKTFLRFFSAFAQKSLNFVVFLQRMAAHLRPPRHPPPMLNRRRRMIATKSGARNCWRGSNRWRRRSPEKGGDY